MVIKFYAFFALISLFTMFGGPSRRKWVTPPLPTPDLPSIPADAANYRASNYVPSTPTVLESPVLRSDFENMANSPSEPFQSSPTILDSPFQQLSLFSGSIPAHPCGPRTNLSRWEHCTAVLDCIAEHFEAFGDFMEVLSMNFARDDKDPRSETHIQNADNIHSSRVALSIWATKLVGAHCRKEVGKLGRDDPLSRNFECSFTEQSTNKDLKGFSMEKVAERLKRRARTTWFLTECMAGSRKGGVVVVRKNRPHPMLLCDVAGTRLRTAILEVSWASGCSRVALTVDLKRVYSRLGLSVADTTARHMLDALGAESLGTLRSRVAASLLRGEPYCRKVLDNVQQYQLVYEPGLGKVNTLVKGTAATAIQLDDCAPGAFNLDDYQRRIMKNERATLTTAQLFGDVDFKHINRVSILHAVRILCEYIPELAGLRPAVSERFRSDPIKKHRMKDGRKTWSSLGHEWRGMHAAQVDFDEQCGLNPEEVAKARVIVWDGGDGGSFLVGQNVKKCRLPQAVSQNVHETFENRLWTTGLWHTKATALNVMAANFYGPKECSDPSSLSNAASATGMHRPSNLDKCDFYPTARTMQLICEAHILDCWSIILANHEPLLPYFENLAATDSLPDLDKLVVHAETIIRRYATTTAYQTACSLEMYNKAPSSYKAPIGPSWSTLSPATASETPPDAAPDDSTKKDDEQDSADFDGIEPYATADGDIGRVWEILKSWIFLFAGSGNHNYVTILLEMYCLFRYEASKDLKDAIWNNWLMNIAGLLGQWIEDDLLQEHYNRWFEEMVAKHGGTFDDHFFRTTLSPSVEFFLRFKEAMESAFELTRRSKSHTSAHLRAEYQILLEKYRQCSLRYFVSRRTMGFIAKEYAGKGYKLMDKTKMKDFHEDNMQQSGSDLAFIVDPETGVMGNEWYNEEEYETLVMEGRYEQESDGEEDVDLIE
ncbi:hypothetical protein BDZ89DRAFT_1053392 [Hymenopellis radicata]|nr:hypothetical protein BDZ89DRAFT_1053392 [Hymenopellis radicata]